MTTDVNIVSEEGVRIVERQVMTTHERVAVWPPDQASQRAWGLSVVTQNRPNPFKDDIDFSDLFKEAERVVNWVNGGRADD